MICDLLDESPMDLAGIVSRSWRAPWTISELSLSDVHNWTSYPAYYPHLVRFPHDDGAHHIAIRVRTNSGDFAFVGDTSTSEQSMTERLERLWAEAGIASRMMAYVREDHWKNHAFRRFVVRSLSTLR